MAENKILTSIHGKRFGLTSSGGLAFTPTTGTGVSRAVEQSSNGAFQAIKDTIDSITSSDATLTNFGLSVCGTGVLNGSVLTLAAPEAGIHKEIFGDSSASSVTLNTTDATIVFQSSLGSSSSAYTFDNLGGVRGKSLRLKGLDATRWAVLNETSV